MAEGVTRTRLAAAVTLRWLISPSRATSKFRLKFASSSRLIARSIAASEAALWVQFTAEDARLPWLRTTSPNCSELRCAGRVDRMKSVRVETKRSGESM